VGLLFLRRTLAVARKDLRSELRTRYALNALGMFVVITVMVLAFSTRTEVSLTTSIVAGLLWVSMFFTAVTGLGRSFVSEEERGTSLLLRLTVSPTPVYFGKLLINILLSLVGNLLIAVLFFLLMAGTEVKSPATLTLVVVLSSLGFASSMTIVAAIIARSSSKGTLYPVLSFPIVLPLMILGIDLLRRSIAGVAVEKMTGDLLLLAIYSALVVVVSYILFDFLWKE